MRRVVCAPWLQSRSMLAGALVLLWVMRPGPALGQRPERIAYQADTSVYTIHPDGSGARKIRSNAHEPVWRPDGERIMFSKFWGRGGIWSMRSDGSAPRLIVGPNDSRFGDLHPDEALGGTWSPDGRTVAFTLRASDDDGGGFQEIWSIGVDGSGLRRLARGSLPDWSPDGRWIAFTRNGPSNRLSNRVLMMAPDGSHVRVLLGDDAGYRHSLDFSPDGRRLAFVELAYETNLRTIDIQSGKTTRIPQRRSERVFAAAWAPDGERIAFVHHRVVFDPEPRFVGTQAVSTIRPHGRDLRRVFRLPRTGPRSIDWLSWRPER